MPVFAEQLQRSGRVEVAHDHRFAAAGGGVDQRVHDPGHAEQRQGEQEAHLAGRDRVLDEQLEQRVEDGLVGVDEPLRQPGGAAGVGQHGRVRGRHLGAERDRVAVLQIAHDLHRQELERPAPAGDFLDLGRLLLVGDDHFRRAVLDEVVDLADGVAVVDRREDGSCLDRTEGGDAPVRRVDAGDGDDVAGGDAVLGGEVLGDAVGPLAELAVTHLLALHVERDALGLCPNPPAQRVGDDECHVPLLGSAPSGAAYSKSISLIRARARSPDRIWDFVVDAHLPCTVEAWAGRRSSPRNGSPR